MRILCTFLEGSQRDLLLAVDFEEGVQPRDLKEVRHSLVDLGKFHLASPLPDDAIASDEFAHAIAVYVIHSGEIEQEFLVAGVGEDVYQVTQLRATITQREFANSVNYNDSVELSCGDLKTHGDLARLCFPRGIIHPVALAFQRDYIQNPVSERYGDVSPIAFKGSKRQLLGALGLRPGKPALRVSNRGL